MRACITEYVCMCIYMCVHMCARMCVWKRERERERERNRTLWMIESNRMELNRFSLMVFDPIGLDRIELDLIESSLDRLESNRIARVSQARTRMRCTSISEETRRPRWTNFRKEQESWRQIPRKDCFGLTLADRGSFDSPAIDNLFAFYGGDIANGTKENCTPSIRSHRRWSIWIDAVRIRASCTFAFHDTRRSSRKAHAPLPFFSNVFFLSIVRVYTYIYANVYQ